MRQVTAVTDDFGRIAGTARLREGVELRPSWRVLEVPCDDGMLLYQTLTREMLLLTDEEYERRMEPGELRDELVRRRFVVEADMDERAFDDQVLGVYRLAHPEPEARINAYTILTTTDCNARCFYCYELGTPRIKMTEEVAHKVASFIIKNCEGDKAKFTWFGGEPLMNTNAIDVITQDLRESGTEFRSHMISNAFIFDDELIEHAVSSWALGYVQVTLDGCASTYARTKAYVGIAEDIDPFERVLGNIESLLRAGVTVAVRMNLHGDNACELMELAKILGGRFGGSKGFNAYAALLRDDECEPIGFAGIDEAIGTLRALLDALEDQGIGRTKPVGDACHNLNMCMADSGRSLLVLPDGRLGLCEHFCDSNTVGDVTHGVTDEEAVASWRERVAPTEACATCVHHPDCRDIVRCPYLKPGCSELTRRLKTDELARSVRARWREWVSGEAEAADGASVGCETN